ncbi:MAG: DNA-formamidopyrimidine glycosylase family protein [Pseudomonadota bacterium]
MPELPDIEVYREALAERLVGEPLRALRLPRPFFLRTVAPAPEAFIGSRVEAVERLAKRIVLRFAGGRSAVMHLMRAGRLRWRPAGAPLPKKAGMAAFDFDQGSLIVTEAGTKRRAALHLLEDDDIAALDPGGIDPLASSPAELRARLAERNHTLKRALTDQRIVAGIGNAFSDEILLAAQLSPFRQTDDLGDDEWRRLVGATRNTLARWLERLRAERGEGFPEKVTAFRAGMAVHGRYGEPCPICGSKVQRIVYADSECNYCARCQTGGRLLADRALSRLLKANWPKTLDELEERQPE